MTRITGLMFVRFVATCVTTGTAIRKKD